MEPERKPSFEEYITQHRLVKPKYASYYAYHVKGFVWFCQGSRANLTWENVKQHLANKAETYPDWKLRVQIEKGR